jgi:3-oxoadipate enol-lactonase
MPKLRVGDLDLHYERRGAGPPLLLVMGWRANLDWWPAELVAGLATHHELVLFDNRGSGRTGDPGGRFGIAQMADDAARLLDALGIARADVFGVSMGGMIAQELAIQRPARVRRLVLACTHCGRRGVHWSREQAQAWKRYLRAPTSIEKQLAYLLFSEDLSVTDPARYAELGRLVGAAPITPWASLKQFEAILRHDTFARLPRIAAPTLVVTGERDLMVPPGNSHLLAGRIPGARLVTFPGTGHALLGERADELVPMLREFLAAEAERQVA